jgi:hypothetical protein
LLAIQLNTCLLRELHLKPLNFHSSNQTLNAVYELGRNTLRVTTLDTFTDSQTRERRPYEADGCVILYGRKLYHFHRLFAVLIPRPSFSSTLVSSRSCHA